MVRCELQHYLYEEANIIQQLLTDYPIDPIFGLKEHDINLIKNNRDKFIARFDELIERIHSCGSMLFSNSEIIACMCLASYFGYDYYNPKGHNNTKLMNLIIKLMDNYYTCGSNIITPEISLIAISYIQFLKTMFLRDDFIASLNYTQPEHVASLKYKQLEPVASLKYKQPEPVASNRL